MRNTLVIAAVVGGGLCSAVACLPPEELSTRVLATGLQNPFEITWGPDDHLWVTERTGKRVTRIGSSGVKTTAATIDEVLVTPGTQDGLLGMALHPELLKGTGNDYVFLAYTYDADPDPDVVDRRTKIARFTYWAAAEALVDRVDLLRGLPGSNDHNSGRLVFGPDAKLYYTIGDQGHNQFANFCLPIRAQELPSPEEVAAADYSSYQGKVLRLNQDGSIPADNPVLAGARSHIYSYGHRNAQGLAFAPNGLLYLAEHGPKSDDEVNLIEAGKNYGWPHIAGFQDDQAYTYANWSASVDPPCSELEFSDFEIPPSVPRQAESAFSHPDLREPEKTFYTVPTGFDFRDPECAESGLYFLCWPTIAPSSAHVYAGYPDAIPQLRRSLLLTSLKLGTLYRARLGPDLRPLPGAAEALLTTVNRYRDVAVHPSGQRLFVATDSQGLVLGPEGPTGELENPGSILEVRPERAGLD